jgi:hypothetical protein
LFNAKKGFFLLISQCEKFGEKAKNHHFFAFLPKKVIRPGADQVQTRCGPGKKMDFFYSKKASISKSK